MSGAERRSGAAEQCKHRTRRCLVCAARRTPYVRTARSTPAIGEVRISTRSGFTPRGYGRVALSRDKPQLLYDVLPVQHSPRTSSKQRSRQHYAINSSPRAPASGCWACTRQSPAEQRCCALTLCWSRCSPGRPVLLPVDSPHTTQTRADSSSRWSACVLHSPAGARSCSRVNEFQTWDIGIVFDFDPSLDSVQSVPLKPLRAARAAARIRRPGARCWRACTRSGWRG